MTQARPQDYWISPNALYIELNAMGNPDYIQASCVSGAQILVYINGIISYDAGHNYRRWTLQASPTVFNTHTEKYVYAAIPRDMNSGQPAFVVFPSEEIDVYGKNANEAQLGSTDYYYIFLQGIITSSGDNGAVQRDWAQGHSIATGMLSSDEAIAAKGDESEWYKYSSVDQTTTFLKNLTMKAGTWFKDLFAKTISIVSGGKIVFADDNVEITGVARLDEDLLSENKLVTPKFMKEKSLSRISPDTAQELIKFLKGLVVGDGSSGIDSVGVATLRQVLSREYADAVGEGMLGEGFFMGQKKDVDGNGYSYLEVDKLLVRKVAEFIKLVIREVKSVGGTLVLSPAAMECVLVEARLNNGSIVGITDSADFYRCYFREEEDGKEISNEFSVGDLARCQTFNVKSGTRYYWRRVVAVGDDYIDLSATDYDKTVKNDVPAVGDEIVVMGNATDTDRQAVIVLSAYGADAPSIALYRGVNSYTMSGKAVVVLSKKEVYILADRLYYRASDGTQTSVANAISKTEEEIKAQGDELSNTKGELTKVTSRVATLEVTSEGITTRVSKTEEEIKAQGDEIRQFDTKIEQTAEEIALEVAETVTSQTNLLRGTAFDATSEGCIISGTRMDGKGYKGANAVLAVNETADALQGVRWVGGSKQGNISLTKGKTYTLTFWTMSTGTNGTVRADVIWQGYATDTSRPAGMTGPAGSGSVINDACKRSVWQMHTATFTVAADAPYSYVEIFLFNRTTDDKTVGTFFSRPMLAEGERYSGWALADGEKTALEANILATGIDIKSHKITATTDSFVIRNNSGKTTAEVNADGVLHTTDAVIEGTVKAKDGYFSGFIRKQPCVITPDTLDSYGATDTTTGYVTIDFTKAGTLVSINGDMKTKLGRSELALVLPYGGTGDSGGLSALCYIDQKIVVLNTSNVTVGIVSKAVGTVSPSGTATIDAGQMMVIEPVVTLSVGAGVTNTTYAVKWNVKRAKL